MNRLYPPGVEYLPQNLDEIFARAVEGDALHAAAEVAQADVSVVLAAPGVAVDTTVTFGKAFEATPVVMLTLVDAGNDAVYINALAKSITTTGFTLRVVSGAAQTVKVRWLAYGRRQ